MIAEYLEPNEFESFMTFHSVSPGRMESLFVSSVAYCLFHML